MQICNNKINIRDKKYIFNENNLLILNETDNKSEILFLKLYSSYVKHTKLIKYHFSKNHAIFYFIYRWKFNYSLEGVHFYLIISIKNNN